jgi:hypothetical protein
MWLPPPRSVNEATESFSLPLSEAIAEPRADITGQDYDQKYQRNGFY